LDRVKGIPDGIHIYWEDGLRLDNRNDAIRIRIGGSIIAGGGNIDPGEDLEEAFPDLESSNIDFRKLDLDMRGALFNALEFRLDIDFANVRDVKDIWIRFTNIPLLDHMKFGHLKEPISLEKLTSIKNTFFMEQALPTKAFTPGRNLGVRYNGDFKKKRITFALGGFWGTGSLSDLGEA
jgi:phosphate-selective porin OprO/OprP